MKLVAGPAYILPAVSSASRPSPGDQAGDTPPSSPVAQGPGGGCASPSARRAARPLPWWVLLFFVPGAFVLALGMVVIVLGVVVSGVGVVLCWPGRRRLSAAFEDHRENTRPSPTATGASHDSGPRVISAPSKGVH